MWKGKSLTKSSFSWIYWYLLLLLDMHTSVGDNEGFYPPDKLEKKQKTLEGRHKQSNIDRWHSKVKSWKVKCPRGFKRRTDSCFTEFHVVGRGYSFPSSEKRRGVLTRGMAACVGRWFVAFPSGGHQGASSSHKTDLWASWVLWG